MRESYMANNILLNGQIAKDPRENRNNTYSLPIYMSAYVTVCFENLPDGTVRACIKNQPLFAIGLDEKDALSKLMAVLNSDKAQWFAYATIGDQ